MNSMEPFAIWKKTSNVTGFGSSPTPTPLPRSKTSTPSTRARGGGVPESPSVSASPRARQMSSTSSAREGSSLAPPALSGGRWEGECRAQPTPGISTQQVFSAYVAIWSDAISHWPDSVAFVHHDISRVSHDVAVTTSQGIQPHRDPSMAVSHQSPTSTAQTLPRTSLPRPSPRTSRTRRSPDTAESMDRLGRREPLCQHLQRADLADVWHRRRRHWFRYNIAQRSRTRLAGASTGPPSKT